MNLEIERKMSSAGFWLSFLIYLIGLMKRKPMHGLTAFSPVPAQAMAIINAFMLNAIDFLAEKTIEKQFIHACPTEDELPHDEG
jgi:hypothetical protein